MVKTKGSADYSFCSRTLSDRLSRKATEEEETNKLEKGPEETLTPPLPLSTFRTFCHALVYQNPRSYLGLLDPLPPNLGLK